MPESPAQQLPFRVGPSGTVQVTTTVAAYAWQCDVGDCGWLGTGHTSDRAAEAEAVRHVWDEHGLAGCRPEVHTDHHRWERAAEWNDVSRCARCGWEIGK